jgi:hypothetical protein
LALKANELADRTYGCYGCCMRVRQRENIHLKQNFEISGAYEACSRRPLALARLNMEQQANSDDELPMTVPHTDMRCQEIHGIVTGNLRRKGTQFRDSREATSKSTSSIAASLPKAKPVRISMLTNIQVNDFSVHIKDTTSKPLSPFLLRFSTLSRQTRTFSSFREHLIWLLATAKLTTKKCHCLATVLLLLLTELSCRTAAHFSHLSNTSHLSNPRIGNWRVAKANGLEVRNAPIVSITDNTYSNVYCSGKQPRSKQ